MYKLFLFLLLASPFINCFKFGSQETLQLETATKLQQLSQTSYGRLLLELIQLHREVGGPVEELMLAIDQFLQENEVKRQREVESYERLRGEYLDLVQAFQVQIAHAKLDIATAVNKLEVVLKPRIDHLKDSLTYLQNNIEENRQSYEEENNAREMKHNHYVKNKKEFDNAILVLEESIELIYNLWNDKQPSFVQVNKAKRSITQLKKTILGQDNTFAPIISALMSIAQDQGQQNAEIFFEQVTNLLNECKQLVVEQMAEQTEQENKASEAWSEREMFLDTDYNNFVKRLKEEQDELAVTQDKINAENELKEDRQADYEKLLIDLKRENEEFQKQTDIHNRLMTRLENDKNLTIAAKQVILQHADTLEKFASQEKKAVDWKNSQKLWD